jgi:hypothetical protein
VPVIGWVALTGQVHGTVSGAGTTGGVTTTNVNARERAEAVEGRPTER